MALYAIGDVHGCARTLGALLDRLAVGSDDTLVFVGDYVDRGPDSAGVIDRLLDLEAASGVSGPTCVFLRGNHDQMMLDGLFGTTSPDLWFANGGRTTLDSYERRGLDRVPPDHVAFLERTRLAYEQEGFVFVHAGLDPALSIADNLRQPDPEILLWTRAHLDADLSAWALPVVCGHTPVAAPINQPKLIAIDTGAVFAQRTDLGRLTAVALPERRFVAVPNAE